MIWTIVRKEILVVLKEKGTFFWLILMPMLFILLFASIFSNSQQTFTVSYYDKDNSVISREMLKTIGDIPGFDIAERTGSSLEEEIGRIRDGKASTLLVIPAGFGADLEAGKESKLELYRDATADTAAAPILAVLEQVTDQFRDRKLEMVLRTAGIQDEAAAEILKAPVVLEDIKEHAMNGDAVTQYVPGYTVMFAFFIMITMVRNFFKDRDSGMLARLRSTPMKPFHYLIGMWIPNILAVLIQSTVLLTFGKIVYDVNLGDLAATALLTFALAVCATGVGLILCMFTKSENQGTAYTQIITMGGAVLAGLWFPFEMMPDFAQSVGKFTPQYWAQQGYQGIMIRSHHLGDVALNIMVLLGFGLGGLLLALVRYKRYLREAVH